MLAIATTFLLSNSTASVSASCGLVKWCFSTSQLVQSEYLPNGTEAVILSNSADYVAAMCRTKPRPRVITIREELASAIERWAAHLRERSNISTSRGAHLVSTSSLAKWQLLAHTEYTALLVTDLDIDFFLTSAGRPPLFGQSASESSLAEALHRAWTLLYPSFLASNTTLIAAADFHTPINTALLMMKPCQETYQLGLRTLATGTFDFINGFNGVGRPQSALPWDLIPLKNRHKINSTYMARRNTWKFVSSTGDQGLFLYVYLVLQAASTFVFSGKEAGKRQVPNWSVDHFYAGYKPWRGTMRCAAYFDFMRVPEFSSVEGTLCHDILMSKAACLRPVAEMSEAACRTCTMTGQFATCPKEPWCPRKYCDPVPTCPQVGVSVF